MSDQRKEDDLRWLQVLQEKKERRARRRRQVLIQRIVLAVFVIAAVAAAAVFTLSVTGKKEKQGKPDSGSMVADTVTDPSEAGKQDGSQTSAADDADAQTRSDDASDTQTGTDDTQTGADDASGTQTDDAEKPKIKSIYQYQTQTRTLGKGILSSHAVLVDPDSKKILACKGETDRIVPASMTKVLTLLTAVEHLEPADLDKKFKITVEITDFCYLNECSVAGFEINEKVTVRDLLYGTILPSGADAAIGLAEYVAGSQEAFVTLMNEKLEELGLSETAHFTNCVGIYDKDHYCTLLDMAAIMDAAFANEQCREILSARTYTTSKTKKHKEGLLLSNWFLRRIEDKDTGGAVLGAKTGYVSEAGNCAVSFGSDEKQRNYICVTADAPGTWKCIYDQVKIYKRFSKRK